MGHRIGFGNNKGGTGKTSSVIGIAAALAQRGRRVLAVDLDPQANLSRRLGFNEETPEATNQATVSEAIKADRDGCAVDAIVPCAWADPIAKNIDLLPSRFDLENRISEAGTVGALRRLDRALNGIDDDYDHVLFDFPPSLGHLTQLGMVAARNVVIVTMPEYDGIKGAIRLRDFVALHAGNLGVPDLRIKGVIVNLVRASTGLHAFHIGGLADTFGDVPVWEPFIPQRTAVAEANDAAAPLAAYQTATAKELTGIYSQLADQLEATK